MRRESSGRAERAGRAAAGANSGSAQSAVSGSPRPRAAPLLTDVQPPQSAPSIAVRDSPRLPTTGLPLHDATWPTWNSYPFSAVLKLLVSFAPPWQLRSAAQPNAEHVAPGSIAEIALLSGPPSSRSHGEVNITFIHNFKRYLIVAKPSGVCPII